MIPNKLRTNLWRYLAPAASVLFLISGIGIGYFLPLRGDSTHFLVALCDQPRLQAEHYRALMERAVHDQVRVAAARYAEGVGVPACFGHECLPDLQALRHDEGAKAWIRSLSRKQVAEVNFGEATGDVDTASDWAKLGQ